METPTEAAVRYAVERGYLTPAQVQAALAQSHASGEGVLPLLRPHLTPPQVVELSEVYRRAAAAQAGGLLTGPSDATVVAPSGRVPAVDVTHGPSSGAVGDDATVVAPSGRHTSVAPGGSTVAGSGERRTGDPGAPGTRIGPYVIERELGRGGMGVVSVARHVELGREVALKQLLGGDRADGELSARFVREGAALAKLNHPGVVRVHDAGQSPYGLYLAMDLVEGESLDRRLQREGPLPSQEAARIMAQVARAIAYAHTQGVLHRDLKPANLLLGPDGATKVTDFGLALDAEGEQERLTETGQMLGTPAYMAPEQAAGEKHAIDARTDVYALGATLFALLTGRGPFQGDGAMQIVTKVLREPAPALRACRPDAPAALESIVAKCLRKERYLRYPSAEALADDLERLLSGEAIEARALTSGERLAAWRRRRPRLAAALLAGGAILATLVAVGATLVLRATAPRPSLALQAPPPTTRRKRIKLTGRVTGHAAPYAVRVQVWSGGAEGDDDPTSDRWTEASSNGDFEARLRVGPGRSRIALTARDGAGVLADPVEVTVTLDATPPEVSFAGSPRWLRPTATLTGTLSEPGCTIAFGDWTRTVPGTEFELDVPYEVLVANPRPVLTDPAGNERDRIELPFRLISDGVQLGKALEQPGGPGSPTLFLQPGDITLRSGAAITLGAGGGRVVSGVGPAPAAWLDVPAGLSRGDTWLERTPNGREGARLILEPGASLRVVGSSSGDDPGAGVVLRGLSLIRGLPERRASGGGDPEAALEVASGSLLLDGVHVWTGQVGVAVRSSVTGGSGPRLRVLGSTLISADLPALDIGTASDVRVERSRIIGEFNTAAGARSATYDAPGNSAIPGGLYLHEGTAATVIESELSGYPGFGVRMDEGSVATFERCTMRKNFNQALEGRKPASVTLRDCDLSSNGGGGLSVQDGRLLLEGGTISHNGENAYDEGMLLVNLKPGSEVRGCEVSHNAGAGIALEHRLDAPTLEGVERCRLVANAMGIQVNGTRTFRLVDCEIAHNEGDGVQAFEDGGRAPQVTVERCVVTENGTLPGGYARNFKRLLVNKGAGFGFASSGSAGFQIDDATRVEGNVAGAVRK